MLCNGLLALQNLRLLLACFANGPKWPVSDAVIEGLILFNAQDGDVLTCLLNSGASFDLREYQMRLWLVSDLVTAREKIKELVRP